MITVTALWKSLHLDVQHRFPDLGPSNTESWDAERFASAVLVEKAMKKQVMELDEAACNKTALDKFKIENELAGQWTRPATFEWEEEMLGLVKRHLYNFFYKNGEPILLSWDQILANGNLGSGANVGCTSTDFYTKMFCGKLTCSNEVLYNVYKRVVSRNPLWASAEESREAQGSPGVTVSGGKLGFVRKDDTISRVIITEPVLNMFFQRGVSAIIEQRLADYGLLMGVQPDLNVELARLGSIQQTFSTLDSVSASNSITLSLCEEFVPAGPLSFLKGCRNPSAVTPNGEQLSLHMLSSMGNGFTSTFQTAFFMCCVFAAFDMAEARRYRTIGGTEKNWGVFGDDVIVPSGTVTRYTIRILELLGFTVNKQKSFTEGPFRESCGGDYLLGANVRPFHCKKWDELHDLYTLWNTASEWIARWYPLPRFMREVEKMIKKALQQRKMSVHLVPTHFPESSGIHTSHYHAIRNLRKDENGSIKIQALLARPVGHHVRDSHLDVSDVDCSGDVLERVGKKTRKTAVRLPTRTRITPVEVTNSAGLFIALLKGGVTGYSPGRPKGRHREHMVIPCNTLAPLYATRPAIVPAWDLAGYPVVGYHWPTLGRVGRA